MIHKNIILTVLSLIIFCCNQKRKEKGEKKEEFLKNIMVVKVKGVFNKDDTFQLLYTNDVSERYTVKKRLSKKIKGSPYIQEIVYILPKEIYPSKVRLDFGFNKKQGRIAINSVTFLLNTKVFVINSKEFLSFFRPTAWINQRGIDNEAEFNLFVNDLEVNGSIVSYAPYFISSQKLQTKLELFIKKTSKTSFSSEAN